LKRIVLYSVIV